MDMLEVEERTGANTQYPRPTPQKLQLGRMYLNKYSATDTHAYQEPVWIELEGKDKSELSEQSARNLMKILRTDAFKVENLRKHTYHEGLVMLTSAVNMAAAQTKDWFAREKAKKYLDRGVGSRSWREISLGE